jgi:hypothetical protein
MEASSPLRFRPPTQCPCTPSSRPAVRRPARDPCLRTRGKRRTCASLRRRCVLFRSTDDIRQAPSIDSFPPRDVARPRPLSRLARTG